MPLERQGISRRVMRSGLRPVNPARPTKPLIVSISGSFPIQGFKIANHRSE